MHRRLIVVLVDHVETKPVLATITVTFSKFKRYALLKSPLVSDIQASPSAHVERPMSNEKVTQRPGHEPATDIWLAAQKRSIELVSSDTINDASVSELGLRLISLALLTVSSNKTNKD